MSLNEPAVSHRQVVTGSNRSFGLVFAGFFTFLGLWPLVAGRGLRWWPFVIAAAFLLTALFTPFVLAPLNKWWSKLGLLLHHIVNPVIMALIFFVGVVPTAIIVRMRGKDPLRLKRDPNATTYWIARQPPGPKPNSMSKQF
jgi:Saxitoxin biosynthesis operon protein SxtJ